MAVSEKRRARFHIGLDESLDGRGGIVLDRSEADAARARVEIFRVLAARLGLVGIAINHFNRADDEDFAGGARLEKGVALPKGNFRLIDLDDAFERLPASGQSSTAAASEPAATRFCKSPRADPRAAAPTCRWNASPSDAPPKTTLAAAAS